MAVMEVMVVVGMKMIGKRYGDGDHEIFRTPVLPGWDPAAEKRKRRVAAKPAPIPARRVSRYRTPRDG